MADRPPDSPDTFVDLRNVLAAGSAGSRPPGDGATVTLRVPADGGHGR